MNSTLTVADVNRAIGTLFNSSDFKPYLNQACQQLLISGRWKGSLVYVTFSSSTGYITLPYEYSSILGVNVDYGPIPVFGQFHRYIESGPGKIDETKPTPYFMMDMGDGFAAQTDIPTAGSTLKFTISNAADAAKVIRVFGKLNGVPIVDSVGNPGINVTLANPTATTSQTFDEVTGISCPVDTNTGAHTMVGSWTLTAVAPDTTATLIGSYIPPDIRPSYHRYQLGTTDKAITCLCQRRFIPISAETDLVWPDNLRAIKAAMQAVQCEDANNYEQAEPLWAIAYDTLNKMTHSYRGAAKPEMNWLPWGSQTAIPQVN